MHPALSVIVFTTASGAGYGLLVWYGLLSAFSGTPGDRLVALIVLPHVIGAPQPESHESPVPADLHHQFVVAVTVTNLIFWVALGGIVGLVRQRFLAQPDSLGKSFA